MLFLEGEIKDSGKKICDNKSLQPNQSQNFKYSLPANLNPAEIGPYIHKGIFICNHCNTKIIGVRYNCTVCKNFDYCEKCESSIPHEHPFYKIRSVFEESRSSALSSKNQSQNLDQIFKEKEFKVQALNIPSPFSAKAQETYTYTLKIKNNGCNKWPDNTVMKCISGFHKDISEGVPSLNAGEEYNVNIGLQAPKIPGFYPCSWRLAYLIKNDIRFFGPKIDVNINVEGNKGKDFGFSP